jgi:ankyrin repeat protein
LAAWKGHAAVVELLLQSSRVDVQPKDSNGITPLLLAAKWGHELVVGLLLEIGEADVNTRDYEYGQTALLWAAKEGHETVVKRLLEIAHVDMDAKDDQDRTAFTLAIENRHTAIAQLLQ